MKEFRGRILVPGTVQAQAIVVDSISFYGDVDPERGVLKDSGRNIRGRILVAKKSHGSTVGSYIIYSMKVKGTAPVAIIMEKAEPIVVAGCVLADIPLVDTLSEEFFKNVEDGTLLEIKKDGKVIVHETSQ